MHVLVVVIGLLSPLGGLVEVALGKVIDSCAGYPAVPHLFAFFLLFG